MKMEELRRSNDEDLKQKLTELRKELIKLNAQVATGTQLKSPGQIKQIKKNIARIVTLIKNKERNTKG